ncbi:MAG TPA: LUD domain-containing protein [Candidatus Dormibacteraeota bacterium]|nr:LUD domain-containing protein [Candidatus Dormibacteraeota bacterium]
MPTGSLDFTTAASEAQLASLAERLRERNFEVLVVDSASDARSAVLERIPAGSEVHSGKSKTLEDAGVFKSLMESGKYTFLRNQLFQMDRQTQMREIRKLGAAPDFMVGSVQAVTEAGQLVAASASGSQLGPYASGAGQLILVIGSQKIVRDLETALGRIREYVQPYEDARLREQLGIGTQLARILILERDFRPGRTTIILVREPIGV